MANQTPSKWSWSRRRQRKADRLVAASPFADGRILAPETIVQALEILIRPGDRVAIEGNNQKQADFLSRALARADAEKIHDLHLLISSRVFFSDLTREPLQYLIRSHLEFHW